MALNSNGTPLPIQEMVATPPPTPSTTTATTLNYFVSQTISNCESDRTQITVLVKEKPNKPTVNTPIYYTQSQTAPPLSASGSGLKWYSTVTGGIGSDSAPTLSTTIVGTSNYFVSQTIGNCESNRAQIQVQISAPVFTSACLDVKVFLEGAMSGNNMTTKLNQQGLLPGQTPISPLAIPTAGGQPYKAAPWNYNGNEIATGYEANVVDWVLISLRTAPQEPATTIYRTAALLHNNGKVTTMAGCPSLNPSQSFFVVVEHRNHIGAVSHDAVPIINNAITYNFTQQQSYIPAG